MFIRELTEQTGVSAKTIRYYESVGLLPNPARAANNYRQYTSETVKCLSFICRARRLGFSIREITDLLLIPTNGVQPCRRVLAALDQRLIEIDEQLAALAAQRQMLIQSRNNVAALPDTHPCGEHCTCYLANHRPSPAAAHASKGKKC